ncbi:MAG: YraN family protein [Gemmataceae bacterium]|nr:YraN family protein [Gemmataceae bacterium]MDW8264524.1 YraN family protein [Gemmataceae bacterium]
MTTRGLTAGGAVAFDFLTRWPWWRRWFGSRGEQIAARFLQERGLTILARNFRCPLGEVDLVARDGSVVVFVEVRSTGGPDPERPALSVDATKQRRLTRLALWFLQRHRLLGCPARFDVVTVHWPDGHHQPTVRHYPHAFEAAGSE